MGENEIRRNWHGVRRSRSSRVPARAKTLNQDDE